MIQKTVSSAIAFLAANTDDLIFVSGRDGLMKFRCDKKGPTITLRFEGETLVLVDGAAEIALDDDGAFWELLDRVTDHHERIRIGAMCCSLTAKQVMQWNDGDVTAETMKGATVFMPCRYGERSYVRDGEVIVEAGLPGGDDVAMWNAIDEDGKETETYSKFMEGEPAVCGGE